VEQSRLKLIFLRLEQVITGLFGLWIIGSRQEDYGSMGLDRNPRILCPTSVCNNLFHYVN
jgi:hypothetical protein